MPYNVRICDDFIIIDCDNGSVWADLISSGWYVWVSDYGMRQKCPAGVYDDENVLSVMFAISEAM